MMARVDATGIVSAGEYALTSLATVIIKSFLEDEQLTRESLALLTGAVISSLGQIRVAAERATDSEAWRAAVKTAAVAALNGTTSNVAPARSAERKRIHELERGSPGASLTTLEEAAAELRLAWAPAPPVTRGEPAAEPLDPERSRAALAIAETLARQLADNDLAASRTLEIPAVPVSA